MTRVWMAAASVVAALGCAHPGPPAAASPGLPPTGDQQQLEQAALERQVEHGLPRMRPCYQREAVLDPGIERRMAFLVYVMPSGKVEDFTLMDAELAAAERVPPSQLSDAMAKCLAREVMAWQFPPTVWHGELQLVQPPVFVVRFAPKPPPDRPKADPAREKPAIKAVIARSRPAVASCYDDYLARAPRTGDLTVHVKFTILPSGAVASTSLVEPAPIDVPFGDCLLGVVRKMSFAPRAGSPPTVVQYPFTFTPAR